MIAPADGLADRPERWPVSASAERGRGAFVTLRTDQVQMPDGEVAARDVLDHPGAVAVVALDEADRVLLVRQYRHPVGRLLWEVPAGLRDVDGESPRAAAERELREEAGRRARDWRVLADVFTSPGISSERVRLFLARRLDRADAPGHVPRHEEAHLVVDWVPLAAAVDRILAGDLHNGVSAVGILSAYAARRAGEAELRDADAPES